MASPPNTNKPKDKKQKSRTPPARRAGSAKAKSKHKRTDEAAFPIVGVGASAGGLEAFTHLLHALPTDTGMAIVLVQHLHPEFKSALTEILARETAMAVIEIRDRVIVEPNHVYVIPPNTQLTLMHRKLHLSARNTHEPSMPIDQFFRSLAADQGGRAIGVILSGTASDGVLGLKAIKAEGGITFAQERATAKYDGMPHSAITAGVVDFVLPPDKIALELSRIARHPYVSHAAVGGAMAEVPEATGAFERIFLLLRTHTGHDFTYYKQSTIRRRVARRMLLHKLENVHDYVRYLQENGHELRQLFHDILINVTGFFRDPEAFDAFAANVVPEITKRAEGDQIRVWVPGCSTGEEAYSIAMVLLECLGERASNSNIQIFATDIDEPALERARMATYPDNVIQDVDATRIARFFSKVEGGYRVNKAVRDLCVFAIQDLIKDPPFSRLHLVSCRNVLIYLGDTLQKQVLTIFHYALRPDGFLLLGTAESIGDRADLFRTIAGKEKMYAKKAVATPRAQFGMPTEVPPPQLGEPRLGDTARTHTDLGKEADRLLMAQYAPAAVVINRHRDILHFRGRTGSYLDPSPGQASFNLMKMVRDELLLDLNAAVREAIADGVAVRRLGVQLKDGAQVRHVNIEVAPITTPGLAEQSFLVIFQDAPRVDKAVDETPPAQVGNRDIRRLEQELAANKEYLQSVIEQQETSNEELRSANEEVQSSNEELQSINEELETAKEELQSTNEELSTVNDELTSHAQELMQANGDLNNLISSMDIPIVIVGPDRHIRRFTPRAEKLLNLILTDVGRPISDIRPNIDIPNFDAIIVDVITSTIAVQRDLPDSTGRWYSMWIHPYKATDNRINGAVIIFIDVDRIKRSLEETKQARRYAEYIIAAIRNPLLVLDENLSVVSASNSYMDVFHVTAQDTIGNLVYRLGNGQWAIPQLRAKLEAAVEYGTEFRNFMVTHDFAGLGERTVSITGRRIPTGSADEAMVLMQVDSTTECDPSD